MTKVITEVTWALYLHIKNSGCVKAITDNSDFERRYAYNFLRKCSGKENFFFGMQTETTQQLESGLVHAHTYAPNQQVVLLHLEIPDEELYKCAFYDFADLIYQSGIEPGEYPELQAEEEQRIAGSILIDGTDDDAIQVVYDRIEASWIVDIERRGVRDWINDDEEPYPASEALLWANVAADMRREGLL